MTRSRTGAEAVRLRWEDATESRPDGRVFPEPAVPADLFPVDQTHPTGNLDAALLATARADPDRPAVVEPGGARTYGELAAAASAVARFLAAHPAWRPGDRVGLVLDSNATYVAAFHGALLAGAVVVPIPPILPTARIDELLEWTECRLRFEDAEASSREWGELSLPTSVPVLAEDPRSVEPGDLAAILLTSGSTGPPKGVMLSRGNLFSNADAIRRSLLRLRSTDRALITLPLHHAFGNSVLQSHLLAGSRVVFGAGRLSPLPAIERHGITTLYEIPDRCVLLERALRAARPPERLRFLAVAGGRLAPGLALALADALAPAELVVMYGQTEATARLTCLDPERLRTTPAAIGRPIPGVEIEVVDEDGCAIEGSSIGWIRARGAGTCLGYWRDPAATAEVLKEGWLWTQDRGSLGTDGLLYHHGRADDVVKIAGRRVDLGRLARDVETAVGASAAAAVPFETADGASRIGLFVVGPDALRLRVAAWCRESLPRDERPTVIEMIERLPRSSSGKLDAAALAGQARQAWRG